MGARVAQERLLAPSMPRLARNTMIGVIMTMIESAHLEWPAMVAASPIPASDHREAHASPSSPSIRLNALISPISATTVK